MQKEIMLMAENEIKQPPDYQERQNSKSKLWLFLFLFLSLFFSFFVLFSCETFHYLCETIRRNIEEILFFSFLNIHFKNFKIHFKILSLCEICLEKDYIISRISEENYFKYFKFNLFRLRIEEEDDETFFSNASINLLQQIN